MSNIYSTHPLRSTDLEGYRLIRDLNLDILNAQRTNADAYNPPVTKEAIQSVVDRANELIKQIASRLPQAPAASGGEWGTFDVLVDGKVKTLTLYAKAA